jgi:hypothetical protein
VETINAVRVEVMKAAKVRDAGLKAVYGQPTAEEMHSLTFTKLRDIRTHAQELRNRFARLLNRGSELE